MKLRDIMESLDDIKKYMALILQGNNVVLKVLSDMKAGQEQPSKKDTPEQQEALGFIKSFIERAPEPYVQQMSKFGDIKKSLEILVVKW